MMSQPEKCIATSVLLFLLSLCLAASAYAADAVGKVINLSGPLLARKADGTVKVLAQKSAVYQGDLLVTEKGVYARIRFIDDSEITLRPSSQLKIENFVFDQAKPETDDAKFNLVKGGLRAVTGALGKRSQERVGLNTPTATIGIRGTTFIAEYVAPSSAALAAYALASVAVLPENLGGRVGGYGGGTTSDVSTGSGIVPLQLTQGLPPPLAPGRAPGLYVQVIDGMINLSNSAGTQNFAAGQFGYTPSFNMPPVILPANPGIQFSPPPVFSSSSAPEARNGTGDGSAGAECEVR